MSNKEIIENIFKSTFDTGIKVVDFQGLSGGCIHQAFKVSTSIGPFFLKYNRAEDLDMFKTEFRGLQYLSQAGSLKVPEPINCGVMEGSSYLILEYIDASLKQNNFWEVFGRGLANMHRHNTRALYGLDHDNYIGRLHQFNEPKKSWIDFFVEMRLEKQITMALSNTLIDHAFASRIRQLYHKLPALIPDEPASLLHGDLWGGNFLTGNLGEPVLIDPAIYFGSREAEMAFTHMFGGFDQSFYHFYNEEYPIEKGFDSRIDIYNIYPSLVHVNLFGPSYLGGIDRVLRKFL